MTTSPKPKSLPEIRHERDLVQQALGQSLPDFSTNTQQRLLQSARLAALNWVLGIPDPTNASDTTNEETK